MSRLKAHNHKKLFVFILLIINKRTNTHKQKIIKAEPSESPRNLEKDKAT